MISRTFRCAGCGHEFSTVSLNPVGKEVCLLCCAAQQAGAGRSEEGAVVSGGTKHDTEKIKLELLSAQWLLGVGQVLTAGARKYSSHNWRLGIARSRLLGACLRHVFAYLGGQDNDPETGLSHLHHASCCLMFASELHETRPDLDDRYKQPEPPKV